MVLVPLVAAKASGQFLQQLRGWHALHSVPREAGYAISACHRRLKDFDMPDLNAEMRAQGMHLA